MIQCTFIHMHAHTIFSAIATEMDEIFLSLLTQMSMEPMIAHQEASTMSALVHFLDSCNSSFSCKKPFVFGRPLDPTSIVRNVSLFADECRFCMRSLYFSFFLLAASLKRVSKHTVSSRRYVDGLLGVVLPDNVGAEVCCDNV